MEEKMALSVAAVAGAVGYKAESTVQIPFSTGSGVGDMLVEVAIGAVIAFAGTKIDHDGAGIAVMALGLGYAAGAVINYVV